MAFDPVRGREGKQFDALRHGCRSPSKPIYKPVSSVGVRATRVGHVGDAAGDAVGEYFWWKCCCPVIVLVMVYRAPARTWREGVGH